MKQVVAQSYIYDMTDSERQNESKMRCDHSAII